MRYYIFLPLILVLSSLGGCKKDDGEPKEYLKFKRKGLYTECEYVSAITNMMGNAQGAELQITGSWLQDRITLNIIPDAGPVLAGNYIFKPNHRSNAAVTWTVTLFGSTDVLIYRAGSDNTLTQFYGPGHISLSQIDGDYIKGTFSFTWDNGFGSTMEFTEGEFSVRKR